MKSRRELPDHAPKMALYSSCVDFSPANHADADDACRDSVHECESARCGDGRASAAHLADHLVGARADDARRASEDVRESLLHGGADERGVR